MGWENFPYDISHTISKRWIDEFIKRFRKRVQSHCVEKNRFSQCLDWVFWTEDWTAEVSSRRPRPQKPHHLCPLHSISRISVFVSTLCYFLALATIIPPPSSIIIIFFSCIQKGMDVPPSMSLWAGVSASSIELVDMPVASVFEDHNWAREVTWKLSSNGSYHQINKTGIWVTFIRNLKQKKTLIEKQSTSGGEPCDKIFNSSFSSISISKIPSRTHLPQWDLRPLDMKLCIK